MVFQQEGQGQPFVHNGTVHAPDTELAMQNARDVFVRRPEATALWVVPIDAIYTQTREELANKVSEHLNPDATFRPESYFVFGKFAEQAQCTQVGEVNAGSPQAALRAAVETYADKDPMWWWVFPTAKVRRSTIEEADPMFAAARDKSFKDQAEYPVVTMMRQLRDKGKLD